MNDSPEFLAAPTAEKPPDFTPSAQNASRSWVADLCLTLPFILLFWSNLARHEMWLDELNAWGISAASPTLQALFANVHYEGHPWLWYFVLWIPSRFTHAPVAMKWVEAAIGAAIYLVIGLLSPFTRTQKVLVFLSYFVAFEYTVISRTYGLMLLFALLYAWHRSSRPQALVGNLAWLGALANTDLMGIMLSGALLLEYTLDRWTHRREIQKRPAVAGCLVYLAMLLFSVHTLALAPDISWTTTGRPFAQARNPAHFLHAIANVTVASWWPFAEGYPHQFWNTDAAFHHSQLAFVPLVLAGIFWIFRRKPGLLLLVGATLFLALCFTHLIYTGYGRHWGVVVVGFLVALWMLCSEAGSRRNLSRVAYVFLAIGALKGVAAMAASWTHPFSETGNVAIWLRANHLADQPIVGASDYNLAGVAEQLQRPVYFLNCNCIDTYMKFSHRRDGMTREDVPDRIARAYSVLHVPKIVLVMDYPLSSDDTGRLLDKGLQVHPLAVFSGSEDHLEFYLYEAQPPPSTH